MGARHQRRGAARYLVVVLAGLLLSSAWRLARAEPPRPDAPPAPAEAAPSPTPEAVEQPPGAASANAEPPTSPKPPPASFPAVRKRVLIAAHPDTLAPLASLIRAELVALDLEVVQEAQGEPPNLDPMDAVIHLSDQPRTATVWTRRSMRLRTLSADPRGQSGTDDMLARHVLEVIRGDLLLSRPPETEVAPPTVQSAYVPLPVTVEPPSPPPQPAHPLPHRWPASATLAAGVLLSPGPLPPLSQLSLELGGYAYEGLRLDVLGSLPLGHVVLEAPEARGYLRTGLAGATIGYDFLDAGSAFSLVPGVGVALQWFHVAASAVSTADSTLGPQSLPVQSIRSESITRVTSLSFIELNGRYRLASWLEVSASARIGAAAPQPAFAIAGTMLGEWGRPVLFSSAGFGIPLGRP